jgi:hypothetical protein
LIGGFAHDVQRGAQPEGLGAGLDDGRVEGEPVDDRGAEPRVGEGTGALLNAELLAMAMLERSSRSVSTWNSSSAPRRSSSR